MENRMRKQQNLGFYAFFISGICAVSSGIVVSLLREQIGFDYSITGTLLSLMSIGNLVAGFATGLLPERIGQKRTVLLLSAGYAAGYFLMTGTSLVPLLMIAFFIVGVGRGNTINTCTVLVGCGAKDRTRSMNLMHSFYALGALLSPVVVSAVAGISPRMPMFVLAVCSVTMWLAFVCAPMGGTEENAGGGTDWSFLRVKKFWVLVALLFCQNAVENSVTGWMVTYFKSSGILSGTLSAYVVTVMWLASLVARLLFAFVFPIKHGGAAMIKMAAGCAVFYFALMRTTEPLPAVLCLFAFSFAMGGMNPTAVAAAGRMTSAASMGILLPTASSGTILMPMIIGVVSNAAGIGAGMASILVPCVGMLLFSVVVARMEKNA